MRPSFVPVPSFETRPAVAPVGDPDWVGIRGDRALLLDGKTPALPLDSFFALNPAMPSLHRLYKAQQAIVVHATATPCRADQLKRLRNEGCNDEVQGFLFSSAKPAAEIGARLSKFGRHASRAA
jgi:hypothetical protein